MELRNLDAFMDVTELEEHLDEIAEALKGLRLYWEYGKGKATAMSARVEGKIDMALTIEAHLDNLYRDLPEKVKVW